MNWLLQTLPHKEDATAVLLPLQRAGLYVLGSPVLKEIFSSMRSLKAWRSSCTSSSKGAETRTWIGGCGNSTPVRGHHISGEAPYFLWV